MIRLVVGEEPSGRGRHGDRGVPAPVDPTPVGGTAEAGLELVDRLVEGAVEVPRPGFGPDDGAARYAGDLDTLAVIRLPGVALMEELDADFDEFVVVPLDLVKLLGNMHPVVVGHLNVSALDDDIHA